MENWENLGKPARTKKEKPERTLKSSSTDSYVDFTVGGNKRLDVILNGALEEIRILGLVAAEDNTAEIAFQLRMSRNRVKNLVGLLSSWLKLAERD